MENNFKVGDRIEIISEWDGAKPGMRGTIKEIDRSTCQPYSVEFDNKFSGGHSCNGKCKDGYGHFVSAKCMKLISKFSVGQGYKVGVSGWGGNAVIKITEVKGERAKYKMLKGDDQYDVDNDFDFESIFGKSLTLLTGKEIGEALKEDKPAAVKEVKRTAKVGEYIKIVHADAHSHIGYNNGDILRVARQDSLTHVDGIETPIGSYEYVVLEGYQPDTVREVKRAAKVGEYIKVTNANTLAGKYKNGDILLVTHAQDNPAGVHFNNQRNGWYFLYDKEYVVLENYKPSKPAKHVWTAAEAEKAKALVLDTVRDIYANENCVVFSQMQGNKVLIADMVKKDSDMSYDTFSSVLTAKTIHATAKCSDTDEPNEWIGKAVALCKLLHKPIPAFIMGKKSLKFSFEKAKRLGTSGDHVTIHCKDNDERDKLMRELESIGIKWARGKMPTTFSPTDAPEDYAVTSGKELTWGKFNSYDKAVEFSDCFTEE